MSERLRTEVVIAGGGLAGLVTAYELIEHGRRVLLLDKDTEENLGGLAKESFGGVHMIGTPHQRRLGIHDTPELAYEDWCRYAEFGPDDHWPRTWARYYCENSIPEIFEFLDHKGVEFLPVVNWPERGLHAPGNSVPRWHIAWGTGHEIVTRLLAALEAHPRRQHLEIRCEHEVNGLEVRDGRVVGVHGRDLRTERDFFVETEHVVIASGGICGGDLSTLRANWYAPWGEPPPIILNGAHRYGDGLLHRKVAEIGGNLTHLDKQWHYAAGVHHPARRRDHDGLSLVPPRSALWLNARGRRIGPPPLVGYTDTRYLVERILREPGQYSWLLLNYKIAKKELAVSGCSYMTAFRYKKKLLVAKQLLFGNTELVERLIRECPEDFVVADSLSELARGMQERNLFGIELDHEGMAADVARYDAMIDRGKAYFNDEQLRRIMNYRTYRGDRMRTCKFQKILDPSARPYIAIRVFILARKSLGGIQTDLGSRVLRTPSEGKEHGEPIAGLYAVGEAAGFGGGGIHGLRSLEGTFLGSCVLTGRVAARTIATGG